MSDIKWDKIKALRDIYLGPQSQSQRERNYWRSDRELLETYHQTLAERIGWKWSSVITDLNRFNISWSCDHVIDFGCGTGIQSLKVWRWMKGLGIQPKSWTFVDQSLTAADMAAGFLKNEGYRGDVFQSQECPSPADETLFMFSHVLNELPESVFDKLLSDIRKATMLLAVEPGSSQSSRLLGRLRDQLLPDFSILGPCTHQKACPAVKSEKDWCHFFAEPAKEAFTSSFWATFSKELGVDLRSLPTSYIWMSRTHVNQSPAVARMIGRARIYKGFSRVQTCSGEGLRDVEISKSKHKEQYKLLKKQCFSFEIS